ncbi:nitrobenzoate reductase [Alloscardovia theropitheci]|uniref:Nitrobenzoate reductase n=1 Tax=Alloscardovia theropitheci TaxID=2496842 RepID=A0A4R0QR34_9BIFI|nr:nitroreductase [Alloscardovia theropitheci]TCD54812.1 nitrobenzoate reductase [Alloscardovia theropitheci]
MEFATVVNERHSVRDFTQEEIPVDVLRQITQLAQKTPTWVNEQPAKVYFVTKDAALRLRHEYEKRINDNEPAHSDIEPMPREKWPERNQNIMGRWTIEFKKQFEPGQVHFNHAQKTLFNAPVFAFITIPKGIFDWAIFDAGAYSNTLMLAAKSLGVDSIAAYATVIYPEVVRTIANIPEDELLVIGIGLGYASKDDINTFVPSRASVDDVMTVVES